MEERKERREKAGEQEGRDWSGEEEREGREGWQQKGR